MSAAAQRFELSEHGGKPECFKGCFGWDLLDISWIVKPIRYDRFLLANSDPLNQKGEAVEGLQSRKMTTEVKLSSDSSSVDAEDFDRNAAGMRKAQELVSQRKLSQTAAVFEGYDGLRVNFGDYHTTLGCHVAEQQRGLKASSRFMNELKFTLGARREVQQSVKTDTSLDRKTVSLGL